jgi:hypothetical protein
VLGLVLLLVLSGYTAGRVHGQVGFREGYRSGYRQGYADGTRARPPRMGAEVHDLSSADDHEPSETRHLRLPQRASVHTVRHTKA